MIHVHERQWSSQRKQPKLYLIPCICRVLTAFMTPSDLLMNSVCNLWSIVMVAQCIVFCLSPIWSIILRYYAKLIICWRNEVDSNRSISTSNRICWTNIPSLSKQPWQFPFISFPWCSCASTKFLTVLSYSSLFFLAFFAETVPIIWSYFSSFYCMSPVAFAFSARFTISSSNRMLLVLVLVHLGSS